LYFIAGKGLKQGDPLFPSLFDFVADVFSKMIFKAAQHGLVEGLLPRVILGGVISLQYADETIIFLKNDLRMAQHLKPLRRCQVCALTITKATLWTLIFPRRKLICLHRFFDVILDIFPLSI
jgi:hypothetical protein